MLEVQLQYSPLLGMFFHFHELLFRGHTRFHLKLRQRQAHRISVQVVSVQVGYVICRFACVISINQRVARLCVAFAYHGDAASHPSLDEKVDVLISLELKLHSRLFQRSVPARSLERPSIFFKRLKCVCISKVYKTLPPVRTKTEPIFHLAKSVN